MKKCIIITALALALALPAFGAYGKKAPPAAPFKKVSDLVALPGFIPGMGTLYVDPATLPVGPFLAYDRNAKLVATVYMVPLEDLNQHKAFKDLEVGDNRVEQVDVTFNAGHPGVEAPHNHITVWHVKPDTAKLN